MHCPKCHHVREPDAKAPDWQCPACGVVYAKARDARSSSYDSTLGSSSTVRHAPFKPERRFALGRWLGLAAIGAGAFFGLRNSLRRHEGENAGGLGSLAGRFGGTASASSDLRALAASTSAADVTIYTTSWCPNCRNATRWMREQGFAFTECDVERDPACTAQWQRLDGHGVPVLTVRGHVMKDGFDSDEFVAALKAKGAGG